MRESWETKPLGEVIKLEYGKPLPKEDRDDVGKFPAYGANGMKCWTNKFFFDKPSIIVGRKGSAGEVTLTLDKFWPLDVTYFVTFDECKHDLIFLYHCLKSLQLTKLAKGVKPGINRNDVYQIEFSFPPLPEQKRIVAILDEAFAGIDSAVANAEKNLANARELFKRYLNIVFTEKCEEWEEKRLGDVCERVSVGHVGSTSKHYCDEEEGIPFLRSQNVRPGKIDFNGLRYITRDFNNSLKKSQLQAGDLLFVRVGANRGDCCYLPEGMGEINCANIVFARPITGKIEFLEYFCRSPVGRQLLLGMTTGSAQGVINTKSVAQLSLPLPPISEQIRIVKQVNEAALEVKCLEAIYQQKLSALAELKQSLLQKAFAGKLTAESETAIKEEAAA